MNSVVVDTDVISFGLKGDTRVARYADHLDGHLLMLSFMTVAELELGFRLNGWGPRRRRKFEDILQSASIHQPDLDTCRIWADITSKGKAKGRQVEVGDAWIAAAAIQEGFPLVTHNLKDFAGIDGLVVISEPDRPMR